MLCYWMYFLNSPSHENSEMVLWSCAVIVVQSLSCVPHGLQHARLPCPSPTPRACSNSCPSSWWCHPITLCHPLLPCLHSFPASGSFSMSPYFTSDGQSTGASAQPQSFQRVFRDDFGVDWLDLLAVQGTLKSLLQPHSSKASVLWHSAFFMVQLSHLYVTTGKTTHLTIQTFVSKVTSLLFNMLPSLVIAFLPRSRYIFFLFHGCSHCPQRLRSLRK